MRRLILALVLGCAACDAILGVGGFTFSDAATPPDAPAPADATDECIGPGGCWACAPTTDDQFLNACGSTCVSFDRSRILPYLTADGSLPPPPVPSDGGGTDATLDAAADGSPDAGGD